MALGLESPSPPIKVENWLRGQPITSFQPGKCTSLNFGQLGARRVWRCCPIWYSRKRNTEIAELRSLESQLVNALKQRTRREAIWTHG
ncbi:hypothetical protein ABIE89_000233 [Bradyrhizobium niftali]